MYSYIPFGILLVTNFRLIYEFKNRRVQVVENELHRRRRRAMNRTVIFITVFFISMTLPGAILSTLFTYLLKNVNGQIVTSILGRLSSSYHAYSLIILYLTNQKFAQKLRSFFTSKKLLVNSSSHKDKSKSVAS